MVKKLFTAIILLSFLNNSYAQPSDGDFHYGFYAGATYSVIDEINTTLIRPIFPIETYQTSNKAQYGFAGGVVVYYRFPKSSFAIQPEISYVNQGGGFEYSDVNDLSYTIDFNYAHLTFSPVVKYYPVGGFNFSVGPQLGMIFDRSNLDYVSNMPDLGPDLQIQQSLREVLKGNNNVSFLFGIGLDAGSGISLDIKYSYGISDVIETQANGFYFIENKNPNSYIQARFGYLIPFYK